MSWLAGCVGLASGCYWLALASSAGWWLAMAGSLLPNPASKDRGFEAQQAEALFVKHCRLCHSLQQGKNGIGPSLHLLAGRKAGTLPGYRYTESLRGAGFYWNRRTLGSYLRGPKRLFRGTRSTFPGIINRSRRQILRDWLLRVTRPGGGTKR